MKKALVWAVILACLFGVSQSVVAGRRRVDKELAPDSLIHVSADSSLFTTTQKKVLYKGYLDANSYYVIRAFEIAGTVVDGSETYSVTGHISFDTNIGAAGYNYAGQFLTLAAETNTPRWQLQREVFIDIGVADSFSVDVVNDGADTDAITYGLIIYKYNY